MFSPEERSALKRRLIERAHDVPDVTAAAELGSAARGEEDRWSDIDLALRLGPGADPVATADAWTDWVSQLAPVTDHLDLWANGALYRVLLLGSTLQIDLSFWPGDTLRAHGADFRLVFGVAESPSAHRQVDVHDQLRWAWLYLLHARSALARGRSWQAVEMLEGLRGQIVGAACRRHGLPDHEGRGVDRLPTDVLSALESTLIVSTSADRLRSVFDRLAEMLADEVGRIGHPHADSLIRTIEDIRTSI